MPQAILPLFTPDMTLINSCIGVILRDDVVWYFQGMLPFYQHHKDNRANFKHIVCQLLSTGSATRSEIAKAFKINERSISRWMEKYREDPNSFFY